MPKLALSVIVLVAVAASNLLGQSQSSATPAVKTYTSPDGVFQFQYPASLILCHEDPKQQGSWEPHQSCEAYVPVCSAGARNRRGVVACLGFQAGPAQKGTTLEAAAFSVVDLGEVENQTSCLEVSKLRAPEGHWTVKRINGIQYHVMVSDGVVSGQGGDDYVYRTFHNGRCYELNTMIVTFSGHNSDPPTPDVDEKPIGRAINLPLATFKFLK